MKVALFTRDLFFRIRVHRLLSTIFLNPFLLHSSWTLSQYIARIEDSSLRMSAVIHLLKRPNAPWETSFRPNHKNLRLFHSPIRRYFPFPPPSHRRRWSFSNTHQRSPLHEIQLLLALPTFPRNPFSQKYVRSSLALLSSLLHVSFPLALSCTHMRYRGLLMPGWRNLRCGRKKDSCVLSRRNPFYGQILIDVETRTGSLGGGNCWERHENLKVKRPRMRKQRISFWRNEISKLSFYRNKRDVKWFTNL